MAQIVLDRVCKTYPGGVAGIDDLSLEIGDGEFMVLVGPSGCGKSTALRSSLDQADPGQGDEPPIALAGGKSQWTARVAARSTARPG